MFWLSLYNKGPRSPLAERTELFAHSCAVWPGFSCVVLLLVSPVATWVLVFSWRVSQSLGLSGLSLHVLSGPGPSTCSLQQGSRLVAYTAAQGSQEHNGGRCQPFLRCRLGAGTTSLPPCSLGEGDSQGQFRYKGRGLYQQM